MIEYLYAYLAVSTLFLIGRMYVRLHKNTVFPGVVGLEAFFGLTWPIFLIMTLWKGKSNG